MFDIDFRIVVIGVVALVVIGPSGCQDRPHARTPFDACNAMSATPRPTSAVRSSWTSCASCSARCRGCARPEQTVTTAAHDVKTGVQNVERELNDAAATLAAGAGSTSSSTGASCCRRSKPWSKRPSGARRAARFDKI
jgi:hypothetical protein